MSKTSLEQEQFLKDFERIVKELNQMSTEEREDFALDIEKLNTNRNFKLLHFYDDYKTMCDIQESSHIEPHIWVGTSNPNPKIMASKTSNGGTGWVEYEIPEDVLISHRMHLTPQQSVALGLRLLKYGLFEEL